MANMFNGFIVAVLIFSTIKLGQGLNCFHCESLENKHCGTPINKTAVHVEPCSKPNNWCLHLVENNNGVVKVIRRCDVEDYCKWNTTHFKSKTLKCATCSTDICNDSFKLIPTVTIVLYALLLQSWYTWLIAK